MIGLTSTARVRLYKALPDAQGALTGWDEPWHYRYVGKEAAQFIMKTASALRNSTPIIIGNYTL